MKQLLENEAGVVGTITRYGNKIHGVIHVGAADGRQEAYAYRQYLTALFEPLKEPYQRLCNNIRGLPNFTAINSAVGDSCITTEMYVGSGANGTDSSSILEPVIHRTNHPNIVFEARELVMVVTLDSWLEENPTHKYCNFLCMDAQGYELNVLRGVVGNLKQFDLILTEVYPFNYYRGAVTLEEMDAYLIPKGFRRVEGYVIPEGEFAAGSGDVLYERVK